MQTENSPDKLGIDSQETKSEIISQEMLIPEELLNKLRENSYEDTIEKVRECISSNPDIFSKSKEASIVVIATFLNQAIVATSEGKIYRASLEEKDGGILVSGAEEISDPSMQMVPKTKVGEYAQKEIEKVVDVFEKDGKIDSGIIDRAVESIDFMLRHGKTTEK